MSLQTDRFDDARLDLSRIDRNASANLATSRLLIPGGNEGVRALRGTVKFFRHEKGFGFIQPDDGGPDMFVHATGLALDTDLNEGDKVEFDVGKDAKSGRPKAENVRVLG